MKNHQKELINSTLLLNQLLDSEIQVLVKLEIVLQIYKNLEILKESLPGEEYVSDLQEIDDKVNKVVSNISKPDFIDKVKGIFDKLVSNSEK